MSEGLIQKEVKETLEKIVSHCFYANRIIDRICSILSVTYVMPITSDIIHHQLAHRYPILADDITNYMDSRDCTVVYGETPKGDQTYDEAIECFNKILEMNLKLESLIKEAIIITENNKDYTTKVYLERYLLKILPITSDILLLIDKAELYGNSDNGLMKLDHDIKEFNLFSEEGV